MAGLWERWQGSGGRRVASVAIVTTDANALVGTVMPRMPAIVRPEHHELWLDHSVQDPAALAPVLEPLADDALAMWPVGRDVTNPLVDDPACRAPTGQLTLL